MFNLMLLQFAFLPSYLAQISKVLSLCGWGIILSKSCPQGNERALVRWFFTNSDLGEHSTEQQYSHEIFATSYTGKVFIMVIRIDKPCLLLMQVYKIIFIMIMCMISKFLA